ncbi:MAG: type I-E CRISPR-associated protein Cse1/CasA [Chloroflexi bacterium]|nr:type I-E CRISPR-associated protein Cse1/CasA [Chloroflexota bacterium]
MTHCFSLIDAAWIPVITGDGERVELGLRDMLAEAPRLREIACDTAIQSTAILPVALAILHRVFGPPDLGTWRSLWQARAFDMSAIDDYLDRWRERFDLFHGERPFMQMPDARVDPKSVIHLVHPMGNTGTLFSHVTDGAGVALSPAEAARLLLAACYFRTAGLGPSIDKRRVNFKDSAFARGVIFWACGDTLFETLLLNLLQYPDDQTMRHIGRDAPAWEMNDPFERRETPFGYLDYLTWSNNRVQLIPEESTDGVVVREAVVVPAINMSSDVRSPQRRHVQREKKGEVTFPFLYFNSDKALWRDYASLLKREAGKTFPPAVVKWLADLKGYGYLEDDPIELVATGMLADQAKPVFYRQEIMPLPLELLRNEDYVHAVRQALELAEEVAVKLRIALNMLAEQVLQRGAAGKPDNKDRNSLVKQWNARERYWTALEPQFWRFINALVIDSDAATHDWSADLREQALGALQHAATLTGEGPWALRGEIDADSYLRLQLNELLNGEA